MSANDTGLTSGTNGRSNEEMRLVVASRVVAIFLPERIAYLSLSGITAILVIWQSWETLRSPAMLGNTSVRMTALATLFGSGGVVAFNLARLLTMFNSVLLRVFGPEEATARTGHGN